MYDSSQLKWIFLVFWDAISFQHITGGREYANMLLNNFILIVHILLLRINEEEDMHTKVAIKLYSFYYHSISVGLDRLCIQFLIYT
jgi:hypothetical protein